MELAESWEANFHFTSFEAGIKQVNGGCAVLAVVLTTVTATDSSHNMAFCCLYIKVAAVFGFSAAAQLHTGVSSSVVSIFGISWQNCFHSLLSYHCHSCLLHCWPFVCLCVMTSSA
jgi:hypothetical protein